MLLRNKIQTFFLFFVAVFMFTGCGYAEKEIIIQKEVETIYVMPPKEAYDKVEIPAPILKQRYLALNIKDREKELGIYITKLISTIKSENMKKDEIVKYLEEMDQKNKKPIIVKK